MTNDGPRSLRRAARLSIEERDLLKAGMARRYQPVAGDDFNGLLQAIAKVAGRT